MFFPACRGARSLTPSYSSSGPSIVPASYAPSQQYRPHIGNRHTAELVNPTCAERFHRHYIKYREQPALLLLPTRGNFGHDFLTFVLYALPLPGLRALHDSLAEEGTHLLDPAMTYQSTHQHKGQSPPAGRTRNFQYLGQTIP